MPGPRRGRGERRLESALEALAGALNETRAPWMVIGAVAVIARGVKRMTTDLDVVVQGDAIEASSDAAFGTVRAATLRIGRAREREIARAELSKSWLSATR